MDTIALSEKNKEVSTEKTERCACLLWGRQTPVSNRSGDYKGRRDKYSYTHRINAPRSTDLRLASKVPKQVLVIPNATRTSLPYTLTLDGKIACTETASPLTSVISLKHKTDRIDFMWELNE